MRRAAIIGLVALAACGHPAPPPPIAVPPRSPTAGDALLRYLPAGAAAVLEVDLARLRANPAVGPVVRGLVDGGAAEVTPLAPAAALVDAEAVVLAAYAPGQPTAHTITVVRGGHRPAAALDLGGDVWALADEGDAAALLAPGHASVADDRRLMALRAAVMPAGADGAAVRVVARLDGGERRALAEVLDDDRPPPALAAWLDVADDLAAIVWLDQVSPQAAAGWRDRVARLPPVRALGLTPSLAAARVVATGGGATTTVVIGPGRLARAVARWQAGGTP